MNLESSRPPTVKELFLALLDVKDHAERAQIMKESGCDDTTKAEVQKLLTAHGSDAPNLLDEAVARFGPSDEPTLVESRAELLPGDVVGSFKILKPIGEGGMGTVYAAEQTEPVRRLVALKIIRAAIATNDVIARFQGERQAIALMDHPHIAKVLEVGTTNARQPYLAMELVEGLSITKYADAHRLTTDERLRLFEKVCMAVRHAHRKGIIHRDLKPSNILVAHVDDAPVPKIIDFGLAKAVDQPLTDSTMYTGFSRMLGTPMYMSPEQAELGGVDVDTRCDIYSLGVILYELLTGVPPFDRERFKNISFDEIRRIVREVEPRRPSSTLSGPVSSHICKNRSMEHSKLRATLRGELDWIVLTAMEKDRERRYDSAGELADDIRRFLNSETIAACPPSTYYRMRKYAWRNRWPLVVVCTIFAALVATSSISMWQVWSVRRANIAIASREQRANELLEAMRFKEAVSAYRQGDLATLSNRTDRWSQEQAARSDASQAKTANFMSLLNSATEISPISGLQHTALIHDVAISADQHNAVCVDEQGDVYLWNLDDSAADGFKLGSHEEPAHAVAVSPDGLRAVTGSHTGQLAFWDLEKRTLVQKIQPLETGVETIRYSPDGLYVAAGARYSGVWVGNSEGQKRFEVENDHRHEALLFSPDASELLVPTREGIDVWNLESRSRTRTLRSSPLSNVRAMCLAGRNQRWLVVGERYSETLVLLDRETGKFSGAILAGRHPRSLVASPDGLWLAASYANGRIQLIQLSDRNDDTVTGEVRYQFQAHRGADEARLPLVWLESRFEFVSAGVDGKIQRWNRARIPPTQELQPPAPLSGLLLQSDRPQPYFYYFNHLRSRIAQLSQENSELYFPEGLVTNTVQNGRLAIRDPVNVCIFELATGKSLASIETSRNLDWSLALSRDGNAVIGGDRSGFIVWATHDSWSNFELVGSVELVQEFPPQLAGGHRTAIAHDAEAGALVEIDLASGERETLHPLQAVDATSICLSHDETLVAIAGYQGIRVIDRHTKQTKLHIETVFGPRILQFFPDDKVLLSVDNDGSVRAWHIPTGESLGALYSPSTPLGMPTSLQITADGRRAAVCYNGPTTRIPVILGRP
ncbi:serine/threonine-protein kinase [Aureliella helgolandensis]|uniref:Serine/threonine-protein kinase StkP n=1 Tax=Aureliella helgolandensis TaxID=2527968 RepID=A0A518G8M2_9BACT|nr:serine/threonine-protein kinase [Aureliella helgolandensis]QDV24932.1 Serine/threonine-protein kinase StkP [Aureliella helgolandensis]